MKNKAPDTYQVFVNTDDITAKNKNINQLYRHRSNQVADKIGRIKGVKVLNVLGSMRTLVIACNEKQAKRIESLDEIKSIIPNYNATLIKSPFRRA